jgi:hypothetical protein
MNPMQNVTDEERRAAGYELRQSANGDYMVFHDLRRAARPPDAALDKERTTWMELERRAVAEMDRRDKVEDGLLNLVALRQKNESALARDLEKCEGVKAVLIGELQAEQRTKRLLIWIGGSVLAIETLALAGLIWRLL